MSEFSIDPEDGTIHLSSGASLNANLTQKALRADPAFADARDRDYGTLPWVHFEFCGGQVDGHNLFVSACFYDQTLVDVSISADLYPPGAKDWSSYSFDTETEIKLYHDELLRQMFNSKPKKIRPMEMQSKQHAPLGRAIYWPFKWGRTGSYHDSKGGGTYICVAYGKRKEECSIAYRKREP
ncbi:MAG: hypothetical protein DHS20C16_23620 [Phycisphaerae bacterium]|nr:MAG: hypothetical protein DHS20C16_23620 [Phycisphaerae bacterium]